MFLKCVLILFVSTFVEAESQYPYAYPAPSCPWPHLDHGRVRVRQRTKLVKFMCSARYELVGNRYATCKNGEWDVPMPVCVRPGCNPFAVKNSAQLKSHHDAWVVTFCLPGYKLIGSSALYCNGYIWNATIPQCIETNSEPSLSCDFENPDLCGWTQDELHDFDWKRINTKTPSSILLTGPSYDHTYGKDKSGYYMYIESTSRLVNDTARLLSPVYDAHLAKDGCFSFFYHMYGVSTGGLKIYQKPDSLPLPELLNMPESVKQKYILFEQWGNLGDFWFSAAPQLEDFQDSFQIIIEGVRGVSFTSDIAIDDVEIRQGINCTYFRRAATSPAPFDIFPTETCAGRCSMSSRTGSCDCSPSCLRQENCCGDFMEICIFNSANSASSDQDEASPSDEHPQTEKLVGETTFLTSTTTEPPTPSPSKPPTAPKITPTPPRPTTRPPTTIKITTPAPTVVVKTTPEPPKPAPTQPSTTKPPTTKPPTTKPPTTKKVVATTKKVVTTQKITTKALPTTKKGVVTTKISDEGHKTEEKKSQKELTVQKMYTERTVEMKSSSWKTAVITIVVLTVFAAVIYLGLISRTTRGRIAIAMIRGRVLANNDSEVRYLNSNDDDL